MSIGITDEEQKIIIDILDKYKEYLFYFYGSRVKGTYEKTSDLDILIKGKQEMPLVILEEIKQTFDESKLPYVVNFSDYHSINKDFYKRIEKDMFPYNWKECKIENLNIQIIDGDRGKNYPNKQELLDNGDCLFLSAQNVTKNGFNFNETQWITKERDNLLRNGKLVYGDIVITTRGTVGNVALYSKDIKYESIRINSGMLIVRCGEGIFNEYIYYVLSSQMFAKKIASMQTGTAQPQLPKSHFQKMEILLPPFETQQKIAKVLSAIDDKIELNNSINNNLEQQAQAIFKSWFVDFEPFGGTMPNDWCNGNLADIAKDIICGKTPSTAKKEYYGNDIPFITIPDMHNNTYIIKTERYLSALGAESQINKLLPANSICVSCIATAGLVSLTSMNSQTNQQINSIIPKKEVSPYYVYMLLKSLSEKIIMLGSSGSTTCNLNKGQFAKIEIIIPSQQILDKFNELVKFLFEQIKNLQIENQQLVQLRDTLLPKLMSGEIDVDKVEV